MAPVLDGRAVTAAVPTLATTTTTTTTTTPMIPPTHVGNVATTTTSINLMGGNTDGSAPTDTGRKTKGQGGAQTTLISNDGIMRMTRTPTKSKTKTGAKKKRSKSASASRSRNGKGRKKLSPVIERVLDKRGRRNNLDLTLVTSDEESEGLAPQPRRTKKRKANLVVTPPKNRNMKQKVARVVPITQVVMPDFPGSTHSANTAPPPAANTLASSPLNSHGPRRSSTAPTRVPNWQLAPAPLNSVSIIPSRDAAAVAAAHECRDLVWKTAASLRKGEFVGTEHALVHKFLWRMAGLLGTALGRPAQTMTVAEMDGHTNGLIGSIHVELLGIPRLNIPTYLQNMPQPSSAPTVTHTSTYALGPRQAAQSAEANRRYEEMQMRERERALNERQQKIHAQEQKLRREEQHQRNLLLQRRQSILDTRAPQSALLPQVGQPILYAQHAQQHQQRQQQYQQQYQYEPYRSHPQPTLHSMAQPAQILGAPPQAQQMNDAQQQLRPAQPPRSAALDDVCPSF